MLGVICLVVAGLDGFCAGCCRVRWDVAVGCRVRWGGTSVAGLGGVRLVVVGLGGMGMVVAEVLVFELGRHDGVGGC